MNQSLPEEITVVEAHERRSSDKELLFLDVREPFEIAYANLNPDFEISLQNLEDHWTRLPNDRPVIVYCHHGMRSLHATKFLRAKGIEKAQSMAGGIDAWSLKIDSSTPRY